MACQHSPDDQTLRLQARAGEDDVIHLPSGLDRVDCERQEEEEEKTDKLRLLQLTSKDGPDGWRPLTLAATLAHSSAVGPYL